MTRRVPLLGASGFIGRSVAAWLLDHGWTCAASRAIRPGCNVPCRESKRCTAISRAFIALTIIFWMMIARPTSFTGG